MARGQPYRFADRRSIVEGGAGRAVYVAGD